MLLGEKKDQQNREVDLDTYCRAFHFATVDVINDIVGGPAIDGTAHRLGGSQDLLDSPCRARTGGHQRRPVPFHRRQEGATAACFSPWLAAGTPHNCPPASTPRPSLTRSPTAVPRHTDARALQRQTSAYVDSQCTVTSNAGSRQAWLLGSLVLLDPSSYGSFEFQIKSPTRVARDRKRKPSEESKKRLEYQLCLSKEAGADDILDISACELTEVFILHSNQLKSLVSKGCSISSLATLRVGKGFGLVSCESADILGLSALERRTRIYANTPYSFAATGLLKIPVLDLHENKLTSLPDEIGQLKALQVLNLERNHLHSLPESIGDLLQLQTLNVKGNALTELPSTVGWMGSLRTLDISENNVTRLPTALAKIRTLECLTLDAASMTFPPSAVCSAGTEATQRFLCAELGMEYCPPSQYLLPVLESEGGVPSGDCVDGEVTPHTDTAWECYVSVGNYYYFIITHVNEEPSPGNTDRQSPGCRTELLAVKVLREPAGGRSASLDNKFQDYEKRKERKQMEKLEFERRLEEEQREQTELVLQNSSRKEDMLQSVKQVTSSGCRGRIGRVAMQPATVLFAKPLMVMMPPGAILVNWPITHYWPTGGLNPSDTCHFLCFRQRKSAEFLQALEEDRMRVERLMAITQEEAESLRRKEVAAAMQKMLSESCSLRMIQEVCEARRRTLVSQTCSSLESLDRKFEQVLSLQQLDKNRAISHILQEEEMQKAAFETLQLQKDSMHCFLRNQIRLIEAELMQLTKLEVKRRDLDTENMQVRLQVKSGQLERPCMETTRQGVGPAITSSYLIPPVSQVEMELKSEATQENYWLIQYQRLLDAKPLSLRMQPFSPAPLSLPSLTPAPPSLPKEAGVEQDLVDLLCKLSAQQYLPLLAHHRVTAEMLRHMTPADLQKMGISEMGIQRALLNWAKDRAGAPTAGPYKDAQKEEVAGPSVPSSPEVPSRPPSPEILVPSAPSLDESPGSSECVVCMEKESQTIFLPCGHVCCCQGCSDALLSCPLCRGEIAQRVRIYRG
ncbi:LRSM1 ligase, partial [Atractosteus spatula]|nr:LRSM1 ligase [Atractosteus spatula]